MATMQALVYEGPYSMSVREVALPVPQPDEVLVRVAYSGICGSELSGYEGKNSLRQPPLIMGHEFSGTIESVGADAARSYLNLTPGARVTVNPLVTCGECVYCKTERQPLCPKRKLLSASLPGSNAQFVAARADGVCLLPENVSLTDAALTEPAACAVHAARIGVREPVETALVVGAGPIGLLMIEALQAKGVPQVYCMELNPERRAMAAQIGAVLAQTDTDQTQTGVDQAEMGVDLAVDAVGNTATRQACMAATKSGGTVVWIGLHERFTALDINDAIRREITTIGSFCYTPGDFRDALAGLADGRFHLDPAWTRVEPLSNGSACFEELLHGSTVAKIWLTPPEV